MAVQRDLFQAGRTFGCWKVAYGKGDGDEAPVRSRAGERNENLERKNAENETRGLKIHAPFCSILSGSFYARLWHYDYYYDGDGTGEDDGGWIVNTKT